jgi:hypothetical protein
VFALNSSRKQGGEVFSAHVPELPFLGLYSKHAVAQVIERLQPSESLNRALIEPK